MITNVYFIRHAEPDYKSGNDRNWNLTDKGKNDSKMVTRFLEDKHINIILSSPLIRTIDTVKDFADKFDLPILVVDDFTERKLSDNWIDDYAQFSKHQWEDFSFKIGDGESLKEVQDRNLSALHKVIEMYSGDNIVIGSHGIALSTIINYYDKTFGYENFKAIGILMPWIVKFTFDNYKCKAIEKINLFENNIV